MILLSKVIEQCNKDKTLWGLLQAIVDEYPLSKDQANKIRNLVLEVGMLWLCTDCDYKTVWSYKQLCNQGLPVCPHCDRLMEGEV